MLSTRFTDRFGLRHPIMSAPMALHSGGGIAAAVSGAGGLGTFGGITTAGPDWVTEQAELVRARTDAAFGIGFITAFLDFAEPLFEAALATQPHVIVLSFGDPGPWIGRARSAGSRVICQVQSSADADRAVEQGADALIVQGNEAGGHTGHMALLPLLSTVTRGHPDVPVIAAGGIGDGATLAAVLAAGADGALLGTAFLATTDLVEVHDHFKDAILESDGTDTVFTTAWDTLGGLPWPAGIGERVRANSFTDAWHGRDAEIAQQRSDLAQRFGYAPTVPDPATDHLPYGSSAGLVDRIRPAAELVDTICADAEERLRALTGSLLP